MDITICDDGFVAEVKNDSDFNALMTMLFGESDNAEEGEWTTYWWEVTDEDSDICGEEFFTELQNADLPKHKQYAHELFPHTKLHCLGKVSQEEAEMMGLDTY